MSALGVFISDVFDAEMGHKCTLQVSGPEQSELMTIIYSVFACPT